MAVETSAGNTEEDINFEVKEGGNVCLTCGARARSVGANGRLYVARTVSRDEPSRQGRGRSGIPSTNRENSNLGRRCSRTGREKMGLVSKIHGQVTSAWSGNTRHKPSGLFKI